MTHSEIISNAVENVAFRLSGERNRSITPAELMPYLPVSIEMVCDILNEAAEESAGITAETVDGIRHYTFDEAVSSTSRTPGLPGSECIVCNQEPRERAHVLCTGCKTELEQALTKEAVTNAWPAKAVYEHEICYLAARMTPPVSAEQLAGASRLTLRRMRRKLEQMEAAKAVRKERDEQSGILSYAFPNAPYPRDSYLRNIRLIRSFPASITEDVEARLVHIFTAIGILFTTLLALAFCHIPFPLLMLAFIITAPILGISIWKRRLKQDTMEVH